MELGNGSEPREPWAAGVRQASAPSGRAPQGKQGTAFSPTRSEDRQPLPRVLVLPEPLRASRRKKHLSRGPVPPHFITQTADLEARARVRETHGLGPCSWQCLLTGVFPGCCCLLCPIPASRAAREVPPPQGAGELLGLLLFWKSRGRAGRVGFSSGSVTRGTWACLGRRL